MGKMIIEDIRHLSNDLFADCFCPVCKEKYEYEFLKFSGYNDTYFFEAVNKEFRDKTCNKCGTVYKYKWTYDGVILKW